MFALLIPIINHCLSDDMPIEFVPAKWSVAFAPQGEGRGKAWVLRKATASKNNNFRDCFCFKLGGSLLQSTPLGFSAGCVIGQNMASTRNQATIYQRSP
jgi:hypothetical protein